MGEWVSGRAGWWSRSLCSFARQGKARQLTRGVFSQPKGDATGSAPSNTSGMTSDKNGVCECTLRVDARRPLRCAAVELIPTYSVLLSSSRWYDPGRLLLLDVSHVCFVCVVVVYACVLLC